MAYHKLEVEYAKLEAELKSERIRVETLERQLSGTSDVNITLISIIHDYSQLL